jgi:hypothetical protein
MDANRNGFFLLAFDHTSKCDTWSAEQPFAYREVAVPLPDLCNIEVRYHVRDWTSICRLISFIPYGRTWNRYRRLKCRRRILYFGKFLNAEIQTVTGWMW